MVDDVRPMVRISLDVGDGGSTYVAMVPVDRPWTPTAFRGAVETAGRLLLESFARDFEEPVVATETHEAMRRYGIQPFRESPR